MNSTGKLTELEALLFEEARRRYCAFGFPASKDIAVVRRVFDDSGRYTFVSHPEPIEVDDGVISLAQAYLGDGRFLVLANLHVVDKSIQSLELIVAGERKWNGEEPRPIVLFRE